MKSHRHEKILIAEIKRRSRHLLVCKARRALIRDRSISPHCPERCVRGAADKQVGCEVDVRIRHRCPGTVRQRAFAKTQGASLRVAKGKAEPPYDEAQDLEAQDLAELGICLLHFS
jgi:metal-dependent amidase/aminoacylase/carboxypeptidase family protein